MPLIVISGLPASGKTTRAKQLRHYFAEKGKRVHLISENEDVPKAGFPKNVYFDDSQKEKHVRSDLKSQVVRLLNKEDVVILDAGNYIKGYRYELFCASKAARSTQCTLLCGIQNERAWEFNATRNEADVVNETNDGGGVSSDASGVQLISNSQVSYTREIFDALCMRYEEPNSNCRWDSPLFVVFPDDTLDLASMYSALFEAKPLPPNQSTQNPPLSSTNYLFELDRCTQQIVSEILSAQKIGLCGPVRVQGSEVAVNLRNGLTPVQLNRLRRQFINYTKAHHATSSSLDKVAQLFVQFINANNSNF